MAIPTPSRPLSAAEQFAAKLNATCAEALSPSGAKVEQQGTKFIVTVPNGFSRGNFTDLGFTDDEINDAVMPKSPTKDAWVVTGVAGLSGLVTHEIWPKDNTGFTTAKVDKTLGKLIIRNVDNGTRPPSKLPEGVSVAVIPQITVTIPEQVLRKILPDIFGNKSPA